MKRLIASDLHGSRRWTGKLLDLFIREEAQELYLLGDLVYSGSYDPRYQFDPEGVMALLNRKSGHILAVEGNCDVGLRALGPEFPVFRNYKVEDWEGRKVFLTHGHRYSPYNPPPMGMADILLFGHTHMPEFREVYGMRCINPGSVSLPRGRSTNCCLIWEDDLLRWVDMDGVELQREVL